MVIISFIPSSISFIWYTWNIWQLYRWSSSHYYVDSTLNSFPINSPFIIYIYNDILYVLDYRNNSNEDYEISKTKYGEGMLFVGLLAFDIPIAVSDKMQLNALFLSYILVNACLVKHIILNLFYAYIQKFAKKGGKKD